MKISNKQIYQCVYGALFGKYFASCIKRGADILSDFICYFKGWADQKVRKQKSVFTSTENINGDNGMEKNPNNNKIQGNDFVKFTAILDQRQVPYFDFEQQPTKTESLWSL